MQVRTPSWSSRPTRGTLRRRSARSVKRPNEAAGRSWSPPAAPSRTKRTAPGCRSSACLVASSLAPRWAGSRSRRSARWKPPGCSRRWPKTLPRRPEKSRRGPRRVVPPRSTGDNPAKRLAKELDERIPVVWGAEGIGATAAARWKTQFNENGKMPAWWSSMSELDHNEVVGWTEPFGSAHAVIALRHEAEDPEIAARFPLSLQIAADAGADTHEVWATGRSSLARLMSLIALGDFTSAYVAIRKGVDPTPVDVIQRLKAALVS